MTVKTRNGTIHKYYINSGDVESHDIPGIVELRTGWRYVLCPGSYVPTDKNALPDATGQYKILKSMEPVTLKAEELPTELRHQEKNNIRSLENFTLEGKRTFRNQ